MVRLSFLDTQFAIEATRYTKNYPQFNANVDHPLSCLRAKHAKHVCALQQRKQKLVRAASSPGARGHLSEQIDHRCVIPL